MTELHDEKIHTESLEHSCDGHVKLPLVGGAEDKISKQTC